MHSAHFSRGLSPFLGTSTARLDSRTSRRGPAERSVGKAETRPRASLLIFKTRPESEQQSSFFRKSDRGGTSETHRPASSQPTAVFPDWHAAPAGSWARRALPGRVPTEPQARLEQEHATAPQTLTTRLSNVAQRDTDGHRHLHQLWAPPRAGLLAPGLPTAPAPPAAPTCRQRSHSRALRVRPLGSCSWTQGLLLPHGPSRAPSAAGASQTTHTTATGVVSKFLSGHEH